MKTANYKVTEETELGFISEEIINSFPQNRIFTFEGEMGAGKTTLIKQICKKLNVADSMSSPTFSIVNEYLTKTGESVYHFDFYRIKTETEALDIGIEEYFYSGSYCFIEWPEKIHNLLPDNFVKVQIKIKENHREINTQTIV
jgi:tRNA threonylcarbamoyladenosine biosynthesis protein TsaE